jgi:hypothetical protein
MFAFFGLGTQEIMLLLILFALGGGVVAIVLVVKRAGGGSSRVQELERENERLRDRLDDQRRPE